MTKLEPTRTSSDLTATERLRRMLDELGVEHEGTDRSLRWRDRNGVMMQAFPLADGELGMDVWSCTPEQAIAATLGSCNCSNSERTDVPRLPHFWTHDGALHVELPKLPESISVRLPDQRDREVGSARVWQYTRDSGTCHDKGTFESWGLFTCSNCSIVIPLNAAKDAPEVGKIVPLKFCPNCGARVVGSTTNNVGAEADA